MIGINLTTNREDIPLNSSKVTWKAVVINGTKILVSNKETSGIPFTKVKTTMGAEK